MIPLEFIRYALRPLQVDLPAHEPSSLVPKGQGIFPSRRWPPLPPAWAGENACVARMGMGIEGCRSSLGPLGERGPRRGVCVTGRFSESRAAFTFFKCGQRPPARYASQKQKSAATIGEAGGTVLFCVWSNGGGPGVYPWSGRGEGSPEGTCGGRLFRYH